MAFLASIWASETVANDFGGIVPGLWFDARAIPVCKPVSLVPFFSLF